MDWIRSPLALIAIGVYALLLLTLLTAYFRPTRRTGSSGGWSRTSGSAPFSPPGHSSSGAGGGLPVAAPSGGEAGSLDSFREEAERLFAGEREPVFAADESLEIFYANRAARKLFGESLAGTGMSLEAVLGAEDRRLRRAAQEADKPETVSVSCRLPNGGDGTAQLRFAVMNRFPRILAIRVSGLEEARPSGWLTASRTKQEGQTSLTRGGRLDFREIDPASVELSADQMLGPLREIDERLRQASAKESPDAVPDPSLQAARGRLRKLIRHIEEIDWMLQVTDGHLHLRPEGFHAHAILSGMAEAANRMAGENGPRLRLAPETPPPVEPLLNGDRRVFEKILTQLLTSAFRSADQEGIAVDYRAEPMESPTHSDDWSLFAGEETSSSHATRLTVRIAFRRNAGDGDAGAEGADLPAVIETLGAAIIDPKLTRRLDFVRKGRDSDLFGLTLARELVAKLEGELSFQTGPEGRSEFVLRLRFDNAV